MTKIILCHKCGGTLTADQKPLYGCGCISSYIRGFEPCLTLPEAIEEQRHESKKTLVLYRAQGRDEQGPHVQGVLARLKRLG